MTLGNAIGGLVLCQVRCRGRIVWEVRKEIIAPGRIPRCARNDTEERAGRTPPLRGERPGSVEEGAGAKLGPEDREEVDGEQEKNGFDGVAVFGDGIDEIIRKRVDEERGGVEKPAAGAASQREEKAEPAKGGKRPEFPRAPPFVSLINDGRAVPEPPGAAKRQVAKLGRIFADEAQRVLLPVVDVGHFTPFGIFLEFGGIGGGVSSGEAEAVAGVVVAEVKLEPEIVAE